MLRKRIFGTKQMLSKKDKIFFFVVLPTVSFIVYALNFSFYD